MSTLNNERFATLPIMVDTQRSRFHRPHSYKTTFCAGELIPFYLDECLPGDTFDMTTNLVCRMTTPIFPVMDNSMLDYYYFFVPWRLLWVHQKEFFGENTSTYWTQPTTYEIPQLNNTKDMNKGSLWDYFGLPTNVKNIKVDARPFRAYTLVWNEWFRDQNTTPPAYFFITDNAGNTELRNDSTIGTAVGNNSAIFGGNPLMVSKYHDYFTSCLPSPQKGDPVGIPITGQFAPVDSQSVAHALNNVSWLWNTAANTDDENDVSFPLGVHIPASGSAGTGRNGYYPSTGDTNVLGADGNPFKPTNLYADLSAAGSVTINALRTAFAVQRILERDALYGTRYTEYVKGHFGVTSPDGRLQRPEYLGGARIPLSMEQVLQTAPTSAVSPQGNASGFSKTGDFDRHSFIQSFTEHGYILGLCCVRTSHTYQQGINRMWSRKGRYDVYDPLLANISEQAVLNKELYAQGGSGQDDQAFGYQEAWAEYRYYPNLVTGAFRSNYATSLDSWHYADYYTALPVLSPEWMHETKANIDRTLAVTSAVEDQFILDVYMDLYCTRPMPVYSQPGLLDHH